MGSSLGTKEAEGELMTAHRNGTRSRIQRDTEGGKTVLTKAIEGNEGALETLENFGPDLLWRDPDEKLGRALLRLSNRDQPASVLAIVSDLLGKDELDAMVLRRLDELLDAQSAGRLAERLALHLSEQARKKRLEELGRRLSRKAARARPGQAPTLITEVQNELEEIRSSLQASQDDDEQLVSLREVLENADEYDSPPTVANRLAWEGRVSLLAGREKLGKSTFVSAAAAATSKELPFLGSPPERAGTVLYFGLEEALNDAAKRLMKCGADPDRVFFARSDGVQPFEGLVRYVADVEPALVVVDSLAAFTRRLELDPGNSSQWARVMYRFSDLAEESGAGLLIVHHARKRDGRYRDSSAIGAAVDMILEMSAGDAENERAIEARGRWALEDYSFVLRKSEKSIRFKLSGGEKLLEERVFSWVRNHPGCSTRNVRDGVIGKSDEIRQTLRALNDQERLENRGSGRRHEWHVVSGVQESSGKA